MSSDSYTALSFPAGSLDDPQVLLTGIYQAHAEVVQGLRVAVWRSFQAGVLLLRAKELLPHGQWLPALAQIGLPPRTSQFYMAGAAQVMAASPLFSSITCPALDRARRSLPDAAEPKSANLAYLPDPKCANLAHLPEPEAPKSATPVADLPRYFSSDATFPSPEAPAPGPSRLLGSLADVVSRLNDLPRVPAFRSAFAGAQQARALAATARATGVVAPRANVLAESQAALERRHARETAAGGPQRLAARTQARLLARKIRDFLAVGSYLRDEDPEEADLRAALRDLLVAHGASPADLPLLGL